VAVEGVKEQTELFRKMLVPLTVKSVLTSVPPVAAALRELGRATGNVLMLPVRLPRRLLRRAPRLAA
jgi:hypothetical protein